MSAKEALHSLIERLPDERTEDALACLQRLVSPAGDGDDADAALARRMGPPLMSGHEFMTGRAKSWSELAAEQGVKPVTRFEDLLGDFWPDDETADEFIAAVREWRREGGLA